MLSSIGDRFIKALGSRRPSSVAEVLAVLQSIDDNGLNRTKEERFWDQRPRHKETYYGFTKRVMAFYDRNQVAEASLKTPFVKNLVLNTTPNIPQWLKDKLSHSSITVDHLPIFLKAQMSNLGHFRFINPPKSMVVDNYTHKHRRTDIMCFNCRRLNHIARECTSTPFCSLCPAVGHNNKEHREWMQKIPIRTSRRLEPTKSLRL